MMACCGHGVGVFGQVMHNYNQNTQEYNNKKDTGIAGFLCAI